MKKTYILLPLGILSLALGTSFVSAYDESGTINNQGDLMPIILTVVDTNIKINTYNNKSNYDKEDGDEILSASGTLKVENDNESEESNENKKVTVSLINDEEDDFEIDGNLERSNDNRGLLISEMAQVRSGKDLRAFVQFLVHENKDFLNVSTKENRLSITRDMPSKFLGFIPFSTEETAVVIILENGTKEVSISRPWFNFFSKNEIDSETISSDIESRLRNIPASDLKATLTATTKARIISQIEAAFIENGYTLVTTTR